MDGGLRLGRGVGLFEGCSSLHFGCSIDVGLLDCGRQWLCPGRSTCGSRKSFFENHFPWCFLAWSEHMRLRFRDTTWEAGVDISILLV